MNDEPVAIAQVAVEEIRGRIGVIDDDALDLLFREARSHNGWQDRPVPDELLRRIYDVMKMGPTSSNCCPARIRFLRSEEEKERLRPAIVPSNMEKTMTAPVIAIIGYDLNYWKHFDFLFPHLAQPVRTRHTEDAAFEADTAFRNGSLEGAYFIIAARALGLDCGSISGFNNSMVDELFFAGTRIKSNFISNIGYGDHTKVYRKFNRFDFDEVCEIP
ncbi:MAG: malonic semialdehyde reductase [Pseudomonadota bacterium]|nr:malonic semialdehyde reductase [Pseudomonadota bacterium]